MKPNRRHLVEYYTPLVREFIHALDGVTLPESNHLPEPFFPSFGSKYPDSALRLIIIGQDTRGWGNLRKFMADPTSANGSGIESAFDDFENHAFTKWGGTRHTFWGFAMMLYAALHGRSDWGMMKHGAMTEILDSFAYGNINAVELHKSTVVHLGVSWSDWEKVRKAGAHLDRFSHIVKTVKPEIAVITCMGMNPETYFEGLRFECVFSDESVTHYRMLDENIDVFHCPHPGNMKYNQGADHFCTLLRERMMNSGMIKQFPEFMQGDEDSQLIITYLLKKAPPVGSDFDKYAFVSWVAEELTKRGTFMAVPTLINLVNKVGYTTDRGTPFLDSRGQYKLVSGAYQRFKNKGTTDGDRAAHNIAVAFRRPNFEYAYDTD